MLLIVGTVRLPPHNVSAALPIMRTMVEASRAEDGCLEYAYSEDLWDAGLIHIKELWDDGAALERHFASPHISQWRAAWPALAIGDRDLRVYEVGAPRPT
ncbi:putative quinol monooxygenase [Sphingomonas sp.]|jgi:quinol monooxygenase YgiN|uniref:putative quinol monooxygenase n=1 Tax=Sphingomonas sp. TaxID=28214 RepID=UPI002D7EFF3A|nr:putative quinol monooxygenase [Sphingomonas sp.]HEU0044951.1 putative quinol monooxygenase [Sphingomonas sp.]